LIIPDNERIKTTIVDGTTRTEVMSVVEERGAGGVFERIATGENGSRFTIAPAATIVRESGKYTDNLISGLVMHLAGPMGLSWRYRRSSSWSDF